MEETFEWDRNKREKTLKDRGLDFADMGYFDWETALTIEDRASNPSDPRFVSIGYLFDQLVVCVWAYRGDITRIISLRRASRSERKQYER